MSKDQQRKLLECSNAISEMKEALNTPGFCEPEDVSELLDSLSDLRNEVGDRTKSILFRIGLTSKHLKDVGPEFIELYDSLPDQMRRHNEELAGRLAEDIGSMINPVEGYDLDGQQLRSIAMDVRNRLVIAGAGTGKTTTIVGLAKHLIMSERVRPDEMLFLSFTNNSVNDLQKRIEAEVGQRTDVTTFHRLGLRIIANAQGMMPKVTRMDMNGFVRDEITRRMSDTRYLSLINDYLFRDCRYVADESDFETNEEYERFILENPLVTIDGRTVKSFGEADIANRLVMLGIDYDYEAPYKVDTRTEEFGQYCPDFHIRGTDIYIEYFGVDRDGNVAPFMRSSKGGDPSEEYRQGMEWKRSVHAANAYRAFRIPTLRRGSPGCARQGAPQSRRDGKGDVSERGLFEDHRRGRPSSGAAGEPGLHGHRSYQEHGQTARLRVPGDQGSGIQTCRGQDAETSHTDI